MLSPPPTPRSAASRPDRLSLRLRSNSGLKLHTNDSALSQYTDYQSNRQHNVYKSNGYAGSASELTTSRMGRVTSPRLSPISSQEGMAWTATGLVSTVPILDLFGRDSFRLAMESPCIVQHLIKYCEDHGCDGNIDFLMKVREYSQATNEMASVLTTISTTYTAIGASAPLNLPPMVTRPLNADVRRIAYSILPSLESVFIQAKAHVEDELCVNVWPKFVKSQLLACTAQELATSSASRLQYPGLGGCFCMADATGNKTSILRASDDFASLTGYALEDAIGQSCGFLQGPFTDPETVRRIQLGMRDRRECVELVLNHRKDGEPFWNLLHLLPLKDDQGKVKYWLGAQVNVSECVTSQEDLLRVLNGGSDSGRTSIDGSAAPNEQAYGAEVSKDGRPRKADSVHSRQESKGAGWGLFPTFRKAPSSHPSSPRQWLDRSDSVSVSGSMRENKSQFATQRFQPRPLAQIYLTAYSNYIVLRCITGGKPADQRLQTPSARKKPNSKLLVAFQSDTASDLLSIRSDVSQADIFHVLAEKANSPSMTKSFRTSVWDSIDHGKSISLELLLERCRKKKSSTVGSAPRPTRNDLENARSEGKLAKNSKHERLLSHWTPLKDANGNVDWVVLILTPGL
ncbi:hypothetical protein BJ170DRAFT_576518 [Xylariales sp. AK1849]|nr:hypothetical protein BJ170DRAFT_576518 [Xylariales sp. AK1849]